ncbi:hypothetical protein BDV30DRAFT_230606 [Aspergillus minisclerotigenes]|uniref:3-beta hydroxysteroid dehydrogenase/isomerase domain-containing protein n=1 Tax=Aspergillus minisclerotigenes TaxID=656917 RepID=A0A5N6IQK7_9EURO|nr:hypothetical protein BDV30DRAFT_230606 [Aspergillus minisclerotigenes]
MEKVLISGGAGFVGAAPPGPDHTLPDGVEFIKVDVTIQEEARKAIEQARPDVIIHAAGIVPALSERFGRRVEGHVWRTNSGVKGLYFTQAAAEAMVLKGSSDTMAACSLRPSGKAPFIVGDGPNLWDVTYVTNVADAHVLAAENLMSSRTAAGEVFFTQNNEPITFRDFCLAIWAHFGHTPQFEIHIPGTLAYLVGLTCGFLTWRAKLVLGYRPQVGIETDSSYPYLLMHLGLCSTYGDRITNAAGM